MYVLKKGLFIAIIVLCIHFYNGCFAKVASDIEPKNIGEDRKDQNQDSSYEPLPPYEHKVLDNEPMNVDEVENENSSKPPDQNGPDQVILATKFVTSKINGRVKLRKTLGSGLPEKSVPTFMSNIVNDHENSIALSNPSPCGRFWNHITYKQYETNVKSVAKAFLNMGLKKHDRVGIIGFNSPEWFYSSLGAIYAGGISVGINTYDTPEAWCERLLISQAKIVVVDDSDKVAKIMSLRRRLPLVRKIIQYKGQSNVTGVLSWNDVIQLGESELDDTLSTAMKSIAINECCAIVFTSGTEGKPKAVMLSHDNLIMNTQIIKYHLTQDSDQESIASYLPLSHIETQITDIYCAIAYAAHVYFADKGAFETPKILVNSLQKIRPTILMGVPRIWEILKDKLLKVGPVSRTFNKYITLLGRMVGVGVGTPKNNSDEEVFFDVFSFMTYGSIRNAIGIDRTKYFISAAAPLPLGVKTFFSRMEIDIQEAYGMTECSGAHAISIRENEHQSVRNTFKEFKSKIENADINFCGHLLIYGRHVFMGYLGLPELNADTINTKGWLRTGDLATKDQFGNVTIMGRKKELLITSKGEKVPPVYIENNVKAELPFIKDAFLIGDNRPFLSILLSLECILTMHGDPTDELAPKVNDWLSSLGYKSFTTVPQVIYNTPAKIMKDIYDRIEIANTKVLFDEHKIKKFSFLRTVFSESTGELGTLYKVKRHEVNENNRDLIEIIYQNVK